AVPSQPSPPPSPPDLPLLSHPAVSSQSSPPPSPHLESHRSASSHLSSRTQPASSVKINSFIELISCLTRPSALTLTVLNERLASASAPASASSSPPQAASQQPAPAGQPASPVVFSPEPNIPPPAKYSGDPNTCRQFLTQCQLAFSAQPVRYASEAAKVAYLVNLLEGPPLNLYNALFEEGSHIALSFAAFSAELKKMYDFPIRGQQAGQRLLRIRQGRLSVREYVNQFRSLAVEAGWNDSALIPAFQSGLNKEIGREIALRGDLTSLDEAIKLAIRVADQISLWHLDSAPSHPSVAHRSASPNQHEPYRETPVSTEPEPMQVDRVRLSVEERTRRLKSQSCLYCGQSGHFIASCPVRPAKGQAPPPPP
uniref:CCHC-type domain-containing protein n=1 Tax=Myripristis murdjan TaxID=586833 RepID=A0A667XPZ7_9TELE